MPASPQAKVQSNRGYNALSPFCQGDAPSFQHVFYSDSKVVLDNRVLSWVQSSGYAGFFGAIVCQSSPIATIHDLPDA